VRKIFLEREFYLFPSCSEVFIKALGAVDWKRERPEEGTLEISVMLSENEFSYRNRVKKKKYNNRNVCAPFNFFKQIKQILPLDKK